MPIDERKKHVQEIHMISPKETPAPAAPVAPAPAPVVPIAPKPVVEIKPAPENKPPAVI
jgi:hypothetical protein